jgi:hypothetical protein
MVATKEHDEAVVRGQHEYRRLLMAERDIARYAWRVADGQHVTCVEHFKIQVLCRRNRALAKSYKIEVKEKMCPRSSRLTTRA